MCVGFMGVSVSGAKRGGRELYRNPKRKKEVCGWKNGLVDFDGHMNGGGDDGH